MSSNTNFQVQDTQNSPILELNDLSSLSPSSKPNSMIQSEMFHQLDVPSYAWALPTSQYLSRMETERMMNDSIGIFDPLKSFVKGDKPMEIQSTKPSSILENEQDVTLRRELILKLGKALYNYGEPSYAIEETLRQLSVSLGVSSQWIALPNLLMVGWGNDGCTSLNPALNFASQGYNFDKLEQVDNLVKRLLNQSSSNQSSSPPSSDSHILSDDTVSKSLSELSDIISSPNPYPILNHPAILILCYAIPACTVCIFGFGGSWLDGVLSFIPGAIVGTCAILGPRIFPDWTQLIEFGSSFLISILTRGTQIGLYQYNNICISFSKIVLGGLAVLLPGLPFTIALLEISSRSSVSGTTRAWAALIQCLLIAGGAAFGQALFINTGNVPVEPTPSCPGLAKLPFWTGFILFLPTTITIDILFGGSVKKQWFTMSFVSYLGFAASVLTTTYANLSSPASTIVASFVIGLFAHLYSRFTFRISTPIIVSAILILVPGSLGAGGALTLLSFNFIASDQKPSSGGDFAMAMLSVSVWIFIGLSVATFLVFPFHRKKGHWIGVL